MATDYGENVIVDAASGQGVSAGSRWIALYTADPGETGVHTNELAASNGYSRQSVTFGAASGGQATNTALVEFQASGGAWSTVTHFAVVDSATQGAGNMLGRGTVSPNITLADGEKIQAGVGQISLTGL